jgi:4-amino-4-deoxy-L-arabinose transferase-like glycosyltransferase
MMADSFAKRHFRACAAALLLAMSVAQFAGVLQDSDTYDEGYHLHCGYNFLKHPGTIHPLSENPPLGEALPALPLLFLNLNSPPPPTTIPDQWQAASDFLYHNRYPVETLLLLSRSVKVIVTLAFGVLIAWWTRRHFGPVAGLVALLLFAFDPNFIAHGHYVTTDVPAAFGFLSACLSWNAFVANGRLRSAALCGVITGIALSIKFSTLLLLPLYLYLYLLQRRRQVASPESHPYRCSLPHFAKSVAALATGALLTVYAAYAFRPNALATYLRGIYYLRRHNTMGHPTYLLGQHSSHGQWFYFPVLMAVKTPTGLLLLFLLALVAAILTLPGAVQRLRARQEWLILIIPPLAYFALSLGIQLNLGLRHVLPVYPFAMIWIAAILFGRPHRRLAPFFRPAAVACLALLIVESAAAFPRYLSFFNFPSGGRGQGWKYAVDSNLDWGQDLKRLAAWLGNRGARNVCLTAFGNAPAEYYVPGAHPMPRSLEAARAAGCLVVMDVTVLKEGQAFDGSFDWLDRLQPTDRVADSFWIYETARF